MVYPRKEGHTMRAYYFFMKFLRTFLIGFTCGTGAILFIAAAWFAVYCMYFA